MTLISIDIPEEWYGKIPSPRPGKKRGWIRELVLAELARLDGATEVEFEGPTVQATEQTWYFRDGGLIKSGVGVSPAEAAKRLGIVGLPDWATPEQAKAAGWLEETVKIWPVDTNPLDV